jgi:hypothetical protein
LARTPGSGITNQSSSVRGIFHLGAGVELYHSANNAMQHEARDYLRLSDVKEQKVAFRIGGLKGKRTDARFWGLTALGLENGLKINPKQHWE